MQEPSRDAPPRPAESRIAGLADLHLEGAAGVFVARLSQDTTEDTLMGHFRQVGEVLHASLLLDRDSGQSRGLGKVTLATVAQQQRAILELNGSHLDGRRIVVKEDQEHGGRAQKGKGKGRARGNLGVPGHSLQEIRQQEALGQAQALKNHREREETSTRGDMRKFNRGGASSLITDGRTAGGAFTVQDLRQDRGGGGRGTTTMAAARASQRPGAPSGHVLGSRELTQLVLAHDGDAEGSGAGACQSGAARPGAVAAQGGALGAPGAGGMAAGESAQLSSEELRARRLARFG